MDPISDAPVAPQPETVSDVTHAADTHVGQAQKMLDWATDAASEGDTPGEMASAARAQAEASLAVAAELRALRLMLTQQLPALRPQR